MRIADRDVRIAIEIIIEELENAEVRIAELENQVSSMTVENDTLAVENERLLKDVTDLSDEGRHPGS